MAKNCIFEAILKSDKLNLISFFKYQGTGNDFIIIDNRISYFKNDTKLVKKMCDRKFGIGADGLICLENSKTVDFKMVYFNADGNESSMCGNGGRCITAFAKYLGMISNSCTFEAIDGLHEAKINSDNQVELKMADVDSIQRFSNDLTIDTGSPHYIKFVNDSQNIDVFKEGSEIRNSVNFKTPGINVNFAHIENGKIVARTYERGVENETLSCGTGVTAVALAAHYQNLLPHDHIKLDTNGGHLEVKFEKTPSGYKNIWLIGPTEMVFKGEISC